MFLANPSSEPKYIKVEKKSDNDILVIQDLANEIWWEHYPDIISLEQINYMLEKFFNTETLRKEINNPACVYELIKINQNPIGYISYCIEKEEIKKIRFSKIDLLPKYHSQGIGRQALEHVRDIAKKEDAQEIYGYVNKKNIRAIKAYMRVGAKISKSVVKDIGCGYFMDDYEIKISLKSRTSKL